MDILKKIKIFLKVAILPIFIYFFITILITFICNIFNYLNSIVITGIAALITIPVLLFIGRFKYDSLIVYSFNIDKKNLLYILAISISLNLIGNILLTVTNILPNDKFALEVNREIMSVNIYLSMLITVIIIPLVEEIIFRGYIYRGIYKISNFLIASIVSSLFFAVIHFNISQGIYAFLAGFVLSYIYYKTNNFLYCYITHFFMNATSFILNVNLLNSKYLIFVLVVAIFLFFISIYSFFKYNTKNLEVYK